MNMADESRFGTNSRVLVLVTLRGKCGDDLCKVSFEKLWGKETKTTPGRKTKVDKCKQSALVTGE